MSEPERCRFCAHRELELIGESEGYRFWRCPACQFIFTPGVTPETAHDRYEQELEGTPASGWARRSDFLVPALERFGAEQGRPPPELTLLDFGAGRSWLPWHLRAVGHRVVAVDLFPPERPHPDRLTGDLLEMRLGANAFDLAYAFQVFEHLPRPRPHLEELLRLTRPGGEVVIHTDMEPPERADGFLDWSYVVPPDHCSYYRPVTFDVFCDGTPHRLVDAGPKTVRIEKQPVE